LFFDNATSVSQWEQKGIGDRNADRPADARLNSTQRRQVAKPPSGQENLQFETVGSDIIQMVTSKLGTRSLETVAPLHFGVFALKVFWIVRVSAEQRQVKAKLMWAGNPNKEGCGVELAALTRVAATSFGLAVFKGESSRIQVNKGC